MDKLLSIVIPVYNVEKYIKKCLDSLLVSENLLDLLDIVIVNDGTQDRSAVIATTYVERFPQSFRVINQKNGGHGSALNRGIGEAVGKYLAFLDSDDWYNTDQFEQLICYLNHCDTDLVFINSTKFYAQENKEVIVSIINMEADVVYDADTYDWMNSGNGPHLTYLTTTVYRTTLMKKYSPVFCEHVMYDDIILQVLPIMAADSFIYTNLNVYHYLIGRPGQSFDPIVRAKRFDNVTIVLKQVLSFIKKHRHEIPVGSTRRAWADDHYSAFCTHHYRELSELPYALAKERLNNWDRFIKANYPDIVLTETVRKYRSLPFILYFLWFRSGTIYEKIIKHLR